MPEGFELDGDEVKLAKSEDEELEKDLADVDESTEGDEKLEKDETMRWDEDEDEEDEEDF